MFGKNRVNKALNFLVEKTLFNDSQKASCAFIYQPPVPKIEANKKRDDKQK